MARATGSELVVPTGRGRTFGKALLGSAVRLDPLAPPSAKSGTKSVALPWQSRAWGYYDEIGEIWFAMNYVGNALRKAKLIIAEPSDDPTAAPNPVPEGDGPDAAQAHVELNRIQSDVGGQGEIIAAAGLNLSIAGEGYLVGWHPGDAEEDGGEMWDFLSTDQVTTDDGYHIKDSPNQQSSGYKLTGQDFIARIWRKHPRWRGMADSPMRAVLGSCDELHILSRAMRAAATSRAAGNGVLFIPEEVTFGPEDVTADGGDGDDAADPFVEDLIEVMDLAIQEPDSAAGAAPLVVRMAADYIDKVKHLTFTRPLDDAQAKQRDELIRRIANGLDLPADLLLGMSTVNHWTGWLIDDQTFSAHLEPLLVLICWALTTSYLRPALRAAGVADPERFVVWYDATAIVKRPNQADDAKDVFGMGELSGEALRRHTGFTEEDAPTVVDEADWDGTIPQGTEPAPGPEEKPSRQKPSAPAGPSTVPADGDNVDKAPPVAGKTPASVAASAGALPRADRLPIGSELLDLERGVRYRLQSACDGSIQQTLEKAGSKLRRKVSGSSHLTSVINGVKNDLVASRLGPIHVHALGYEDHELVESDQSDLHQKWEGIVTAAQRRVAVIAHREGADIDPDDYVATHKESRDAGWTLLAAGLAALATARLYAPHPAAPPLGEHDTTMRVPLGMIRGALDRAGGAAGTVTDSGAVTVPDASGHEVPAGGLAMGPDALDAFSDADVAPTGAYIWTVGAPDRPFEPHQDLDGDQFDSWSDDVLAADSGDFPFVTFYWPGDHEGCACDAIPQFDESGPAPLALVPGEDGTTIGLIPGDEGSE